MSLKAKIEAIIYAAEEPITVEQISLLVKDIVLAEEAAAAERAAEAVNSDDSGTPVESGDGFSDPLEQTLAEADRIDQHDSSHAAEVAEPQPAEEPAPTSEAAQADDADSAATAEEVTGTEIEAPAEAEGAQAESDSARVEAPDSTAGKKKKGAKKELSEDARVRVRVRNVIAELVDDYANTEDHGIEIRAIAGGFKMATRAEHHDVVRAFAKSLKPPVRLSLAALETLAVVAYKQPVTVPEISEIRGVESAGVIGTLLDRKLITTSGRKQVVGRPMLYKTSKDFLMRFGLNEISELPSMEEFEKLASDGQGELFTPTADANASTAASPEEETLAEEQAPSNEGMDEVSAPEAPVEASDERPAVEESAAEPPAEDES